jgi:hypothetical protein
MCQVLTVFLLSPVQEPLLFRVKAKALSCLRYIDCNYLEFRSTDRTVDSSDSLHIFRQNIGVRETKLMNK